MSEQLNERQQCAKQWLIDEQIAVFAQQTKIEYKNAFNAFFAQWPGEMKTAYLTDTQFKVDLLELKRKLRIYIRDECGLDQTRVDRSHIEELSILDLTDPIVLEHFASMMPAQAAARPSTAQAVAREIAANRAVRQGLSQLPQATVHSHKHAVAYYKFFRQQTQALQAKTAPLIEEAQAVAAEADRLDEMTSKIQSELQK